MTGSMAIPGDVYPPFPDANLHAYQDLYKESMDDPDGFWAKQANIYLTWFRNFDKVRHGGFEEGDIAWFIGGQINACYNCVDRHVPKKGNQVAILHEGDEPGTVTTLTYAQLQHEVCKVANVMKEFGVRKGDVVTVYMPMVPEAAVVMLACARIGAPHSVVFAGFSAESLRDRIDNCKSKWIFTSNEGRRGGKVLKLKAIVDDAVENMSCVEKVFTFKTTETNVNMRSGRDVDVSALLPLMRPYCPCEVMDSEDTLFILYTSGSTGKPKGVAHSTAGYMLYTSMTTKTVFNLREGDVYACVADIGWITGHSYIVYGPLANGTTTVMFESTPLYPDHGRYWDMVARHRITQFYTAPTAIRSLMRFGSEETDRYDLSCLRVLGSVGEPINPEAWKWYYEHVGKKKCSIVDTWWQTETGGHLMTPLPGVIPMKPGSCSLPFFGVEPALVDPSSGKELEGNGVEGVLVIKRPWPSIARTVYGDHERYLNVYMKPYGGYFFTGDACRRDEDGFYWITGRVDDVINVSGHRIGTAEVESALVTHPQVSEAAVVGFPEPVKGQGICCYITLKEGVEWSNEIHQALRLCVRTAIGPFAMPDLLVPAPGLPKTRSGKIMRRILRKIAEGEEDKLGDISTLADPSVVEAIISTAKPMLLAIHAKN